MSVEYEETGQGLPALDWTYGAHGVEIEVDVETGEIEILKIASSFDVGKVMNETLVRGQIVGGVIQDLGSALCEEFRFSKAGEVLNPSFVDYKILTARDIPHEMVQHVVETPQVDGPYGARSVAEHPMISVPPTAVNALYDALEIDYFRLPLNAERIYRDIKRGERAFPGQFLADNSYLPPCDGESFAPGTRFYARSHRGVWEDHLRSAGISSLSLRLR